MELKELEKTIDKMITSLLPDPHPSREYKQSVLNTVNLWNTLSLAGGMYEFDTHVRLMHHINRKINDFPSE